MAAGRPPTKPLTAPPFDLITFGDLRVQRICGGHWAYLAEMTVAQAVHASKGLPLASTLAQAAAELRTWATQVAGATLDQLADELLSVWETARQPHKHIRRRVPRPPTVSSPPLDPAARHAAIARFGLDGQPPGTLERAGQTAGLTRERVRQITAQIRGAALRWVWAPALDEALRLADHAQDAAGYTAILADKGLTERPWHPAAVASLARLCGRTPPDQLTMLAVPAETLHHIKQISAVASTLITDLTLAPLAQIAHTAGTALGHPVTVEQVRDALASNSHYVQAGEWVGPRHGRANGGRLPHITQRLLALAQHTGGTVTVELVHAGLQRRLRHRGIRTQPPVEAIGAYLHAHPDYAIHRDGHIRAAVVRALQQIPPPHELFAAGTLAMIDIIMAAPGNIISREDLLEQAQRAGVGRDAACQILLYSEALTRHSHRLWTLTGLHISDHAAAAARSTLRHHRPFGLEGETDDKGPWWTIIVTESWLTYARLERQSLNRYAGRYPATDRSGRDVGVINIHNSGRLTGLRKYLHQRRPPEGARLQIRLNLQDRTAVVDHSGDACPEG